MSVTKTKGYHVPGQVAVFSSLIAETEPTPTAQALLNQHTSPQANRLDTAGLTEELYSLLKHDPALALSLKIELSYHLENSAHPLELSHFERD